MERDLKDAWPRIRRVLGSTRRSTLHVSVATVRDDGTPHVAPIGSMRLYPDCTGIYFELFTTSLAKAQTHNARVCVLAVNSGKWFWLRSLMRGRFLDWPGVRLYGEIGKRRDATEEELQWWAKQTRPLRWTKGYDLLWKPRVLNHVRSIRFDGYAPLKVGQMTREQNLA